MECKFISWCMLQPAEQAAWFQGIASVIAIGIAIAVPAFQHFRDRKRKANDDTARARSLAMSLLSDFQAVANRLNKVWSYEHQDSIPKGSAIGPYTREALYPPDKLAALSDRLHELGPAGAAAQRCVYHLGMARDYTTHTESGEFIAYDHSHFYDHLWEATGASAAVLNVIDDMFREKKPARGNMPPE